MLKNFDRKMLHQQKSKVPDFHCCNLREHDGILQHEYDLGNSRLKLLILLGLQPQKAMPGYLANYNQIQKSQYLY